MADGKKEPRYRWAAFTHWANLAAIAAAGFAGATIDPMFLAAIVPLQAAYLWIVPDLPPFRAAVKRSFDAKALQAERAYCLEQLWGLHPRPEKTAGQKLASLFVNEEPDDYDERIIEREAEAERYLEMREILRKLREMVPLHNARVTDNDIRRLEHVVNGYLRILIACRPLGAAVRGADQKQLERELEEVNERLEEATATLRPVLVERKRLLDKQLERIPRLGATLELLRARAEAILYQLRNVHSQVMTDPSTEVQGMLDEMVERQEMLADPLGDLATDQSVRELLDKELGVEKRERESVPAARKAAAGARERQGR